MTDPATITLGTELTGEAERPLPGTRAWFAVSLAWMIGLTAVALVMLSRYEQGDAGALGIWLLVLMCFYLSLCNSLLPLPTMWIILIAASPEANLFEAAWLRAVTVAGLGALATVFANLNEYHGLAYLFRYGLGRRIRQTNVYRWALRWFDAAPFQALALIGFVPIPVDALRWLAILRHYSRLRFALAYFLGRGLRYLLFAWFAVVMPLDAGEIALAQAVLIAAVLATRLLWPRLARRRWRAAATAPSLPEAAVDKPLRS